MEGETWRGKKQGGERISEKHGGERNMEGRETWGEGERSMEGETWMEKHEGVGKMKGEKWREKSGGRRTLRMEGWIRTSYFFSRKERNNAGKTQIFSGPLTSSCYLSLNCSTHVALSFHRGKS